MTNFNDLGRFRPPVFLFHVMAINDIFLRIAEAVATAADMDVRTILSESRREEVVQARCILVYFLYEYGFFSSQIADLTGISRRSVNNLISMFNEHRSDPTPMQRIICAKIRKHLEDITAAG